MFQTVLRGVNLLPLFNTLRWRAKLWGRTVPSQQIASKALFNIRDGEDHETQVMTKGREMPGIIKPLWAHRGLGIQSLSKKPDWEERQVGLTFKDLPASSNLARTSVQR